MGAGSNGLTRTKAGLALAACVAVIGVVATAAATRRVDGEHADRVHRVQAAAQSTFDTRVARLTGRADQYAEVLRRSRGSDIRLQLLAAPRSDFTAFAVAGPDLPLDLRTDDPAALRQLRPVVGAAAVEAAAATARDSGNAVATVVGTPARRQLVVVWPVYADGVADDTQARRAGSAGWVVGAATIHDVTAPVVATPKMFGDPVLVATEPAGPGAVDTVLREGVHLRLGPVPRDSALPVWLLGGVTALAVASLIAYALSTRRREDAELRRQDSLERRVGLVSELSVTLQESLDIGILLPSTLALISDELGLASVRVLAGPGDRLIEVLALGRRPGIVPAPRWSPEEATAKAGQLIVVPMRRAARTLGVLEAVPASDMDAATMASLRQSADMLAGALYNADLYEREQESVRRLRELDELKDDFLGTVSHELRTPLSVLVGSVTLLAEGWERIPDAGRRAAVAQMQPHVTSLTHLVNDLLDFISQRRTTTAEPETIDLDGHVRQLGEQLRPLCHRQQLRISAAGDVEAWTDSRAVERIVGNLVANAAKYSPPDTTIDLTVAAASDAMVSVTDHGPGIHPEDREHLFERFYRGNSDAARTTRGSGIGLAVTLAWVRAVGGRVDVTTAVGVGTTVTVHFPISPDQTLDGAGTVTWHDAQTNAEELVR